MQANCGPFRLENWWDREAQKGQEGGAVIAELGKNNANRILAILLIFKKKHM